MENSLTRQQVSSIVCESMQVATEAPRVDPQIMLKDLRIDSNDTLFLAVEIEKRLMDIGINISGEEIQVIVYEATADPISTVNDFINSIHHRLMFKNQFKGLLSNSSTEDS